MKMQHASYKNQKLKTHWGDILCDATGTAEVHADAEKFFHETLKFKKLEASAPEAPAAPATPVVEPESPAPAPAEQQEEGESEEETAPEKSQFAGKSKKGSKK